MSSIIPFDVKSWNLSKGSSMIDSNGTQGDFLEVKNVQDYNEMYPKQ